MADYTVLSDTSVDPDAPLTSQLGYAWRDNPIAIAEGAAGAPRIQFAAMANAFYTEGGLGSIAFLGRNISPGIYASAGATTSGSNLQYAGVYNDSTGIVVALSGASPSGTWQCMGLMVNGSGASAIAATSWVRVS